MHMPCAKIPKETVKPRGMAVQSRENRQKPLQNAGCCIKIFMVSGYAICINEPGKSMPIYIK